MLPVNLKLRHRYILGDAIPHMLIVKVYAGVAAVGLAYAATTALRADRKGTEKQDGSKALRPPHPQDSREIENGVVEGRRLARITEGLGVNATSVSRELMRNRSPQLKNPNCSPGNDCAHYETCGCRRVCDSGTARKCNERWPRAMRDGHRFLQMDPIVIISDLRTRAVFYFGHRSGLHVLLGTPVFSDAIHQNQ